MSRFELGQPASRRLRVIDLHPHLMCVLCGGYYVDATTIVECLHSFCKSCLVKYLESNKYCPICEVQVHKTKPLLNIRSDETLQNMVYKLVPGLFHKEMKLREEFYAQHPDAAHTNPEDRGVVDPIECQFYSPDEPVSLALEFKSDFPSLNNGIHKRYLRCPAAVTVAHLQKLVRNKYNLPPSCSVDVMFDEKHLTSDFSIMDVAYTFQRKRKEQFHFTYRIVETPCKKRKLDESELDATEPIEADPSSPVLPPSICNPPVKSVGPSQPESKSKLDSIISRLGIAKQTENGIRKGKSGDEWKEVQLQISESGVMSVTDISSIDKLINSIEKNVPSISKETSEVQKEDSVQEKKVSAVEPKIGVDSVTLTKAKDASSSKTLEKKEEKVETDKTSVTNNSITGKNEAPKSELKVQEVAPVKALVNIKKEESKISSEAKESVSTSPTSTPSMTSKASGSSSSTQHSIPSPKVQALTLPAIPAPSSFKPSVAQVGVPAGTNPQLCVTLGSSQVTLSISPSPCMTSSATVPPSNSTSLKASSSVPSTAGARAAPAPVVKQVQASTSVKKSSSTTVGYKTLKCGPKNWNPSISRNSFLSSKAEQQPQQQGISSGTGSSQAGQGKPAAPPRFFKMRNTPRYLGNPASGVKAMYQVPDSKPETTPSAKSPSVMKLDPRTLTPIVSNSSSPSSKSVSVQPKGRPPFPSTTLSAQVTSNHLPSSRSVTATTTTSSSATKHSDLSAVRSSPTQSMVHPFLSPNPFMKGMPNLLYGVGPGLLPPGVPPFANMLRPGLSFPPVTGSGFHANLPQTASMLFNPHALHRQISSSSPGSPTGFPSSLPPSPSMSLSPSSSSSSSSSHSTKTYSTNQRTLGEKNSMLGNQSSPSRSTSIRSISACSNSAGQEAGKVNGSGTCLSSSVNVSEECSLTIQESRLESKTKAYTPLLKDSKTTSPCSSTSKNNNNNLSISKVKSPSEKTASSKSPLDVPSLLSKNSGGDEQLAPRSKTPSSTSLHAQQS